MKTKILQKHSFSWHVFRKITIYLIFQHDVSKFYTKSCKTVFTFILQLHDWWWTSPKDSRCDKRVRPINFVVNHCCHSFLSIVVVNHCCQLLLSIVVVNHCCQSLLSIVVVNHCCQSLLSIIVVHHCCQSLLSIIVVYSCCL